MVEMRVSAGDLQSVPKACVEWKTEELCLPQRLSQHCLSESFFCIFMVTQRGTINLYFTRGDVGIDFFPSSSPFLLLFSLMSLFRGSGSFVLYYSTHMHE